MAKRLAHIQLSLFVNWLHRRRIMGGWHKLNEFGKDWPFGERTDPWLAIAHWISRNTGFEAFVVEEYMRDVSRSAPTTVDPYTSRELFKWWEDGAGKKLIAVFWDAYPEVAKSMPNLPKPKKPIKRRKKSKRSPPTTLSKREQQVKLWLELGKSQADIARELDVTESWVSQLVANIERKEAACKPRSVPMGQMLPLHSDYSSDATASKRIPRQRGKKTN